MPQGQQRRARFTQDTRRVPAYAGSVGTASDWAGRGSTAPGRPVLWLILLAVVGVTILGALTTEFDPMLVLAALAALGAVTTVLIHPGLAVALVAFVVYLNIPAILTQQYGLPEIAAGSIILLLGVPLVAHVIVHHRPLKGDRVFTLMLVFLGTLLLSSTVAVDRNLALGRVQQFIFEGLLVFWLFLNVVRDLPTLRMLMLALLASGTIVSGLSLYQDVTGNYSQEFGGLAYRNYDEARDGSLATLSTPNRVERGRFDRAQGPVNEPNRFAQIMVVLVPFAIYLFRTSRSRAVRLAVAVMGVFVLIGIVLTLSRGAMVALALMAVTMAGLGWIRSSRLVVAGALALFMVPLVTPFYMDRITSITNITYLAGGDASTIRGADGAMRGRLTEMLAAFNVFLDHPFVGVGPGQFAPYYVQAYSQDPDIQFRDIREARRAHTLYFELAAENGALGLGVFMAIVLFLAHRLWRARQALIARAPPLADLATACLLSILAYLWTAVFLHMSYQRYYWLLLAISTAALHVVTSEANRRGAGDITGF